MKAENIPEFIALIKRYESITLEEILSKYDTDFFNSVEIAERLTGFGSGETCTLCTSVESTCSICVYNKVGHEGCHEGEMNPSYNLIWDAEDAHYLLEAFKKRAIAMREYAKKINIEIP